MPLHIGLITADDSAAYNDFYAELLRSGFGFQIYLYNALMQGSKAEKEICQALEHLGGMKNLDVIVVTRGGGSLADLSCFDSQAIAEQIAATPLPVLSGIGHEINITVTDLAAHTHQKTPTAVAQFLVGRVQAFLDELKEKFETVTAGAEERIQSQRRRLKDSALALQQGTTTYLKMHQHRMIRIQEVIKQRPLALLRDRQNSLMEQKKILKRAAEILLANSRSKVVTYQKMVDIVHPAHTIKRGFSITRTKDGSVLRSVQRVKVDQELSTEVADGIIASAVTGVEKV